MNIILKNFIYIIFLLISSLLLINNSLLSKLFTLVIPIIIAFNLSNIKYKSWFSYIKVISIFIPLIFYSNYNLISKWVNVSIFSYILAINIIEFIFLVEFNSKKILSKINGICMLILVMYTPIMILKNNIIGYENNNLWGFCNLLFLSKGYLFNSFIFSHDIVFPVVYSNIISTVMSLLLGSSMFWVPLRIYSLAIIYFIDIIFPNVHKTISRKFINKYPLPTNKYYNFDLMYTVVNIIFCFILISRGYQNTILESLINNIF